MKKFMVADLIKDLGICSRENKAGCKEYNDSIGEYAEYAGKYYDITAEFDYTLDNYVLTIDYHKTGSEEQVVDGATAEDFINNGLDESKRKPPMPWPFGSKDHLHWPNQVK